MANIYVIVLFKIYQTPSQFDIMCPATKALTDSRHQQNWLSSTKLLEHSETRDDVKIEASELSLEV